MVVVACALIASVAGGYSYVVMLPVHVSFTLFMSMLPVQEMASRDADQLVTYLCSDDLNLVQVRCERVRVR